jgi:co-chaperonin GroES (HSP10)
MAAWSDSGISTRLFMSDLKSISQVKKVLNNRVLVRTKYKAVEARTKGGIYLISPSDLDWRPAEHTNRISEVVLPPERLDFNKRPDSMPWDTDMELQKGDIVWHDFMAAHNCPVLRTAEEPEEEYKLLSYYDIYLAKRGEEFIPLNGYVLCEEVKEEKSKLEIDNKINKKLGKVVYLGKPNRSYKDSKATDEADIQEGDIIIKRREDIHILLESAEHQQLDKPYFIIQRKDIYAKYETSHSNNSRA